MIVCWVPGHSGILGNAISDRFAGEDALRSGIDVSQVPYQDMKPILRRKLCHQWQQEWDEQMLNKLVNKATADDPLNHLSAYIRDIGF